jgi:PIN domain nuclease of toxin-antitoxin system
MILLDTNAILWSLVGHRRAAPVAKSGARLYISPVSLLEMKYLIEAGRLGEAPGRSLNDVAGDPRWHLDSPSSDRLFEAALDLDWTRDPFDRLIAAHALHRRWRLATGDSDLKANLPDKQLLAL